MAALDRLDFRLAAGERLAVVGESGSGKSVTALSLLGLLPAPGRVSEGRVRFEGEDLLRLPGPRLRQVRGGRIGYVPQDPMTALDPVLTIGVQLVETLRAHQALDRRRAWQRSVEMLGRVQVPRPEALMRAYPHELSGGLRQRVAIAIALVNEPTLVLADEPTTALDVTVQAGILALLDELCEARGTALVLISHDLGLVWRLCQRLLVFYAGRVVESGPVGDIVRAPAHPYTRALLDCAPRLGRDGPAPEPIPGQPPPLDRLPPGCHFAGRCRHAREVCRRHPVALENRGADRQVRCVRAGELPPWRS